MHVEQFIKRKYSEWLKNSKDKSVTDDVRSVLVTRIIFILTTHFSKISPKILYEIWKKLEGSINGIPEDTC
ncbi:MAG: hypothetical protein ACTSX9_09230 [Candidatus Njordarchaeales archaeon]